MQRMLGSQIAFPSTEPQSTIMNTYPCPSRPRPSTAHSASQEDIHTPYPFHVTYDSPLQSKRPPQSLQEPNQDESHQNPPETRTRTKKATKGRRKTRPRYELLAFFPLRSFPPPLPPEVSEGQSTTQTNPRPINTCFAGNIPPSPWLSEPSTHTQPSPSPTKQSTKPTQPKPQSPDIQCSPASCHFSQALV